MKIEPLFVDIAPTYISFEFQACKGDGTAFDPTGTPTLAIYEEGGADGTYDNAQVTGSPFNLAKINSVTGNYGVLVAKSLFTAGKIYRCIYSATVDSIVTKKVEILQACNASQFKASGYAVPGDAMILTSAYDRAKNALKLSEYTTPDNTSIGEIKTEVLTHPTLTEIEGSTVLAKEATLASHETARANMQTAIIADIDQKVTGSTSINILSATKGAIQVSYAKTGGTVEVVKGDTISIPYGPLGKDITGRKLYFAVKQLLSEATYKIAIKEITAQVTSPTTFTGTIPLSSVELNLTPGNYYAEIESRASDGISTPATELKFILKVVDQVIG